MRITATTTSTSAISLPSAWASAREDCPSVSWPFRSVTSQAGSADSPARRDIAASPPLAPVDALANDGDGLLIDAGRVPALDRGKVRLARLVARAPDPAMAFEEIGGRGQRVGLGVEVDDAVAVAIDGVKQHALRQELGLADLAMHGATCRAAEDAAIDELERRIKLVGEVFGPAAVIGEGGDRGNRRLVAHEAAEAGLHSPDGDEGAGRNAKPLLDRGEQARIGRSHALAPGGDGRAASLRHELIEAQLEAFLAAVGPDGSDRIFGRHERGDGVAPEAVAGGLAGEDLLPALETAAVVAARGGMRRAIREADHGCEKSGQTQPLVCHRVPPRYPY